MPAPEDRVALGALRHCAIPLSGSSRAFDTLLAHTAGADCVLLGEASHGTHEFYATRAAITRRLIAEQGFNAVAIEGDWPDTAAVHRCVVEPDGPGETEQALSGFIRFPQWMWRNSEMLGFVEWLRRHNATRTRDDRTGCYGLDLYGLHASVEEVLRYLREADPPAAVRAAERYACFDTFGGDLQHYGHAATLGLIPSCEAAVVAQLADLQRSAARLAAESAAHHPPDALFFAEQNARLVASAERYYRIMMQSHAESWNLRDRHMAETLEALLRHLGGRARPPRVVVWAHNSHVGDARATERQRVGELTLGQLMRERASGRCVLVGFSTYSGTVTAADDWDEPAQRKRVRHALPGSYEALFHDLEIPDFLLPLDDDRLRAAFDAPRLQRAIGVIYRPDTERQSHYFFSRLAEQFDFLIYCDETRALSPLAPSALWLTGEPPETYPSAL